MKKSSCHIFPSHIFPSQVENCRDIERQVPREECENVPKEVCENVPKQVESKHYFR